MYQNYGPRGEWSLFQTLVDVDTQRPRTDGYIQGKPAFTSLCFNQQIFTMWADQLDLDRSAVHVREMAFNCFRNMKAQQVAP